MTERAHIQVCENEANGYSSHEDFRTIFHEDLKKSRQLLFLLTRAPARAERCLVSGVEDCTTRNPVFLEGPRSGVKRATAQKAIRELKLATPTRACPGIPAMLTGEEQTKSGWRSFDARCTMH
jgi:hypothetical protein